MPKSPALIAVTMLTLFCGGAGIGGAIGGGLDPRSRDAIALGMSALPISFAACMLAWHGVRVIWLLVKLPVWIARGRPTAPSSRATRDTNKSPIPLTLLFMPISALVCAGFGLAIAWISRALFVTSFFEMLVVGLGYGWIMHRAARAGYLLPPEEI